MVKTPEEIECLKISSTVGDAAMWKIKYEWLKPGIKEADITAKVNEFLYAEGFDFVYDIIVASGGNTSPYRRWHTDRMIRDGDLVVVDINAIGPGGYFVDYVRCFKVGGKWTAKEKDLYKEVYDSMYAGLEQLRPGKTTRDVAENFPVYDDDKYGTVTLQQFAHSIGLSLYEGMWISRLFAGLPRRAPGEHVLRHRDLRWASGVGTDCSSGKRTSWFRATAPVIFTMMEHYDELHRLTRSSRGG